MDSVYTKKVEYKPGGLVNVPNELDFIWKKAVSKDVHANMNRF